MKIYIAGRYALLAQLAEEAKLFKAAGHEVTSSWLDNAEEGMSFDDIASADLKDVEDADILVLYTEPYGTPVSGGGRHVEFGYAMGFGKSVYIIGARENVFHWHPDVKQFPRAEYLIRYLSKFGGSAV